jgi:lipopolysaccharide/colanic/teichoic acid biosynthesis glycosyltransferase
MYNDLAIKEVTIDGSHDSSHQTSQDRDHFFVGLTETIEPFFVRKIPLWKRGLDLFGSIIGLVLFSPLFFIIALIIKIVSPGPVFFKQERIGYGGKAFSLIKFRTMEINTDTEIHQNYCAELINGECTKKNSDRPMIKLDDDNPNIIPFGKIIRKTCLDELPQFLNVLCGDMSLVGPRPPIPYEVEEYLRWHKGRFDAIPGMTGLWQVSGKNRLSFKEMVRLDIRYSRSLSLFLDLKILLMTPYAIISEFNHTN